MTNGTKEPTPAQVKAALNKGSKEFEKLGVSHLLFGILSVAGRPNVVAVFPGADVNAAVDMVSAQFIRDEMKPSAENGQRVDMFVALVEVTGSGETAVPNVASVTEKVWSLFPPKKPEPEAKKKANGKTDNGAKKSTAKKSTAKRPSAKKSAAPKKPAQAKKVTPPSAGPRKSPAKKSAARRTGRR